MAKPRILVLAAIASVGLAACGGGSTTGSAANKPDKVQIAAEGPFTGDQASIGAGALRAITLAVEAAVRLWRSVERARLLGTAVKVGPRQFPRIHALVEQCTHVLHIAAPQVYVTPVFELNARRAGLPEGSLAEAFTVLRTG